MDSSTSEDDELTDLEDDGEDCHMPLIPHDDKDDHLIPYQVHADSSGELQPCLGMEFESDEAAKDFYYAYASRVGFRVRISVSRRSRNDDTIIMRRYVCAKEGYHSKRNEHDEGKKKRKRVTTREGCKAMIEIIRKYHGRWVVSKLVMEHSHVVAAPSKVHYVLPEAYANMDPFVGMEFESDEAAKAFYMVYAGRLGFSTRIRRSCRSTRDDSFILRRFVCTKEGFDSREDNGDDSIKKQKHGSIREGCKAMIEVVRKDTDKWVISKVVTEHCHSLGIPSKVPYVQLQGEAPILSKGFAGTIVDPNLQIEEPCRGLSNPLLDEQGCQSDTTEIRLNAFGGENVQNLINYFKTRQAENPLFYYAVQVDNNDCMTNVFWADDRARLAYDYFGDAVTFDRAYKKDEYMMPFATFTGVNHHLQSVIFGCAILIRESEASFIWLLENWLRAMGGRHPISMTTDQNKNMEAATGKVFPNTHHRFCKWDILNKCKDKLSKLYLLHTTLEGELEKCVNDSETIDAFESRWESILCRYNLKDNTWLQSLFSIRQKWVPVYLNDAFFAEVSLAQNSESMNNFFKTYFNTKTTLQVFVTLFEQAMVGWYEKETLADFATAYTKPILKTPSPMEKQAAEIYTRAIFDKFQDEYVESLGYYADRIEDGSISKYTVAKDEDACNTFASTFSTFRKNTFTVTFDASVKKASCSCHKFEFSGILCRHVLRVFLMVGVRMLPDDYILKRWTRNAKSGVVLEDCLRYNDLCRDAIKFAKEGATSMEMYHFAKDILQKALAQIMAVKNGVSGRWAG